MNKISKVLIAVDNEPLAEKVASTGFQLAQLLNAEMALVSVVDTAALIADDSVTPIEMSNLLTSDYKKSQQLLIDTVFKDYEIKVFLGEGRPFEVILKVAQEWEADLIVLGTHGRKGLSHLFMGSVAEKVIRHSSKPLFIIPTKP